MKNINDFKYSVLDYRNVDKYVTSTINTYESYLSLFIRPHSDVTT